MSDPVRILVLSTSLSEESRSKQLSRHAAGFLQERGVDVLYEDLQDHRILPYGMDGSEGVDPLRAAFDDADGILFAFPVYNYNMNASLKAVIERFGRAMTDKVVGLMMAAGGRSSYMSGLSVANSLALDFRCWVVPRFVYATKQAFGEDGISDAEVLERIESLAWTVYEKAWQHGQRAPAP